jgi:ribosomal protein S18 acetylase RimI-like enzyme
MIEFRPLAGSEIGEAVSLWEACGLTRSSNDPAADAKRAIDGPCSTIISTFAGDHLIGTAVTDWDDNCGRIYYLGVEADFRRWGIGRKLIRTCEDWLAQFNAPKVQLMVLAENDQASRFCEAIGYEEETYGVYYRQLRSRS